MPKTKKYKAMILKHAERLREPEFRMLHAAEELKSWVMETREQGPALNVKHCAFFCRCRILYDETPLLTREAQGGQDAAVPAAPLEPSMTGITMSGLKAGSRALNQRRQRHQQAADEAESEVNFVRPKPLRTLIRTLSFLQTEHGNCRRSFLVRLAKESGCPYTSPTVGKLKPTGSAEGTEF